ncbi:hypothetical protein Ccrd_005221 [Cynara cardunculus var. scolymus]|uniref:Uncharacterized protein n=1 Tax=Cynara cardunculus var. scolymus TaxID=59895 RepID=A0A103XL23_CYNCS|nr:hypothetical protein Ccrd_005221 [Cynara cardunculus var. scolymus]
MGRSAPAAIRKHARRKPTGIQRMVIRAVSGSVFRSPSPTSGSGASLNAFKRASALFFPTSTPGLFTSPVALPLQIPISVPNTKSAAKNSFRNGSTITVGFAVSTHRFPNAENTRHASGCKSTE